MPHPSGGFVAAVLAEKDGFGFGHDERLGGAKEGDNGDPESVIRNRRLAMGKSVKMCPVNIAAAGDSMLTPAAGERNFRVRSER